MLPMRWLSASGRVFAGLLLLATMFVGEVADAHHHMSERGCTAETGGRDDNCTCGSMHAGSPASEAPAQGAPIAHASPYVRAARTAAPHARPATHATPRAPPTA